MKATVKLTELPPSAMSYLLARAEKGEKPSEAAKAVLMDRAHKAGFAPEMRTKTKGTQPEKTV